jgi:D-3-phosphoglycerate dehydrogenase
VNVSYDILRLSLSSYCSKDFITKEKQALESIKNTRYHFSGEKTIDQIEEISSMASNLVLITNTDVRPQLIPTSLLEKTRCFIHPNSGYDQFTADWVLSQNIPIILGHEIRAYAVAEFVLSCLFDFFTPLPVQSAWDPTRSWPRTLLSSTNLLLVGYGHIGKIVARSLSPLVKSLHIVDPYCLESENISRTFEPPKEPYDGILLCCGLNPSSQQLVNPSFLNQYLSTTGVLINGARGGLVDTTSLLDFLAKNPRAKAYLDVHEQEPYPTSFYGNSSQVEAFSHIAGVYQELEEKMIHFEYKIMKNIVEKGMDYLKEKSVQPLLLHHRYKKQLHTFI